VFKPIAKNNIFETKKVLRESFFLIEHTNIYKFDIFKIISENFEKNPQFFFALDAISCSRVRILLSLWKLCFASRTESVHHCSVHIDAASALVEHGHSNVW